MKRINELIERYRLRDMPEPKRDAFIEANGAVIVLRWWGQKPIVSIMRSLEEKARLTVSNKFGDVIPISAYKKFQQTLLDMVPELCVCSKTSNAYDLEFNTSDNVATFYFLLDRIDSNKDKLANTIKKNEYYEVQRFGL